MTASWSNTLNDPHTLWITRWNGCSSSVTKKTQSMTTRTRISPSSELSKSDNRLRDDEEDGVIFSVVFLFTQASQSQSRPLSYSSPLQSSASLSSISASTTPELNRKTSHKLKIETTFLYNKSIFNNWEMEKIGCHSGPSTKTSWHYHASFKSSSMHPRYSRKLWWHRDSWLDRKKLKTFNEQCTI